MIGQKLVYGAVSAAAIVSVLLTAPTAHADNQSYLAAVSSLSGLYTPEGLLVAGKEACRLMGPHAGGYDFGIIPDRVADMIWQNFSLLERDQAALVVNASIDNLCPGKNLMGQYAH